jgi:hypothetical protein
MVDQFLGITEHKLTAIPKLFIEVVFCEYGLETT